MAETIATLLFYLFASFTVLSAVMVISSKNPVHSVLFFILAFFNSAGLFLLVGGGYIALTLVLVYFGAGGVVGRPQGRPRRQTPPRRGAGGYAREQAGCAWRRSADSGAYRSCRGLVDRS